MVRGDLIAVTGSVIVSEEAIRALGGRLAAQSVFADVSGPYTCPICGQPGRADADTPAAVMVLVYGGGDGRRVACLAHPTCGSSCVVVIADQPAHAGAPTLPAMTWLRAANAAPNVVVACIPHTRIMRVTPTGAVDRLTTNLLERGFIHMTHPTVALPHVEGMAARRDGALLGIHGPDQQIMFRVAVDFNQPWWSTAAAAGRVGLVVSTGPRVNDTDADRQTDLIAAICSGAVVGATVPLTLT